MSLNARAIALQGIGFDPRIIAVQGFSELQVVPQYEERIGAGIRPRRRADTPAVSKPVLVSYALLLPTVGQIAFQPALVRSPEPAPVVAPTVEALPPLPPAPVVVLASTPSVDRAKVRTTAAVAQPSTAVTCTAVSGRVRVAASCVRPSAGATTRSRIGMVNAYGFTMPPKTVKNPTEPQLLAMLELI